MTKLISFEKLREICEDKLFEHRGNCYYFIKCKRGIPFCNERVCPIWNGLENGESPLISLSEIHRRLNGKRNISIHEEEEQRDIPVSYQEQADSESPDQEPS